MRETEIEDGVRKSEVGPILNSRICWSFDGREAHVSSCLFQRLKTTGEPFDPWTHTVD